MRAIEFESEDDDGGPLYSARKQIFPQSVSGPFRRTKWILMAVCLGIYYLLPFVRWNRGLGAPDQAVLIDLANNRFYFFFIELWPQEVYYFTGLLIAAARGIPRGDANMKGATFQMGVPVGIGLAGKTSLDDILAFDPTAVVGADKKSA